MENFSLPTEVLVTQTEKSLGTLYLDWMPQPGNFLELYGNSYKVLERRHRYNFMRDRYHLCKVAIYVQLFQPPLENTLVDNCWIIGDATCKFNARSELIRCAVNPLGPCAGCTLRETVSKTKT